MYHFVCCKRQWRRGAVFGCRGGIRTIKTLFIKTEYILFKKMEEKEQ